MKVAIKDIGVELSLKTKPMEIEVQDKEGKTKGTLSVNKAHVMWRKARHAQKNSIKVTWEDFIKYMESL